MILEFIFRWAHVLFGIVWIGMLYYFKYFKEAEADAKADAVKKLAPRALWWFRWGAMFTFLTGLYLLHSIGASTNLLGMPVIWVGALAGTLMFLNVWLIIWPKQQVVLGLKEGDGPSSAAKAQHAVLRPHAVRHAGLQAPVHRRRRRHRFLGLCDHHPGPGGQCPVRQDRPDDQGLTALLWVLLALL
jgi:uncharacterized membrane protein